MALQDNNLMLLDLSDGFPRTIDNANDTIRIGVDTTLAQDLSVGGNLTVTGDIISGGTMDVVVADNFIDLSNGQVNGSNKAGGLTVNVQSTIARVGAQNAVFQDQASAAGAFATLSIPGFDPSTGGVGGASLADGDIIEIAGCADLAGNNGLFVVEAITAGAGGLIEIKNASQTQAPWAQTNFESGTETAAAASFAPAVDLGVFCISDGALLDIGGNPIPVGQFVSAFDNAAKLSTLVYEAAANVSLQEAYNVGQQILMSDAQGNLDIRTDDTGPRADFLLQNEAGAQSYLATSAGSLKVGDGAVIKVNMAGQVSSDVIFDGVGARNIQQTGQDLSLKTVTSGKLFATSAGEIEVQAASNLDLLCITNSVAGESLSIVAQNAGAGTNNIGLIADGAIGMNAAAMNVNAQGIIDIGSQHAGPGAIQMSAPNGAISVTSSNDQDFVSTAGDIKLNAQAAGVAISSNNADVDINAQGTGKVDIDGANGVTVDAPAGGFQISGAGAASSIQAGNTNLTVETVGGGNLNLNAAGNVSSVAATNWGATATGGDISVAAAAGAASVSGATTATFEGGSQVILRSTAADLDIDAQTNITMDSVGSTNLAAGSTFTATTAAGNATLSATGGVARVASTDQGAELFGATTAVVRANGGDLSISHNDAGSRLLINTQGTGAGAGSEALSINSSGAAIMEAAANLILKSNTADVEIGAGSGGIDLLAANDSSFAVTGAGQNLLLDAQAGNLELRADAGAGHFLSVDGKVLVTKDLGFGVGSLAAAALAVGDVVYASSGTQVDKASRTSVDCPIGLVMEGGANIGDDVFVHTAHGMRAKTALAAVAGDVGKFVYLDAAGALTMTAPVASGDYVWRLGCIVGIDVNVAVVLWAPQFIAKRP